MKKIFAKLRLRPTQMRTVADRRFEDAEALRQTGRNARANGAIYLGGFVIECLLKAKLLETFPWLQNAGGPQGRSKEDQHLWSLCYRSHDLDLILDQLPAITERLSELEQRGHNRRTKSLKSICAEWSVHIRYSPFQANIHDAQEFLDQVKELKPCLL